jgi:tRNA A-37 threonylcarbamoyl transferase component Bud32
MSLAPRRGSRSDELKRIDGSKPPNTDEQILRDYLMSTSPPEPSTTDDELIALEPTHTYDMAGAAATGYLAGTNPGMALPEATLASMVGELDTLRRSRLLAASVFLAATYAILCVWVYASDNPGTLTVSGDRFSLRVVLIGSRCLLAAIVAGLLASELHLSRKQLRAVEYALFLGLTLLIMASQYFVGLDLVERGTDYVPTILAFVKDGVIQTLVLMMIYGTLIPNRPTVAAGVLAAMFIGPVITFIVLSLHPQVGPIVERLSEAEEAGSNILFLAIGTALALYGSFTLNGLRTQLHHARKFGQYQLVTKLGEGGMGEVYLAEHQLLKRPCALKLIKAEAGADPIALARFEREVRSAARLRHPNTIDIYDYGLSDDGTFYYVMEYLEGMSLSDLVRRAGPLPPGRVIYLFRQVCAALSEAHTLGLVHRDLKPANIFVAVRGAESDVAKVLDFGLVKLMRDPDGAELTGNMTISGTPMYMAPEQALGDRSLDSRADIYALGAMMYFTLTGQPPFVGENPFTVMMAHARDPVVPPSQIKPDIPDDLEQVVLRCLAKKAVERYQTVKALSEALAACRSATDWGPNRADAWWSPELPAVPNEAPAKIAAAE